MLQKKEFNVSAFSLFVVAILPFPISRSLILDVVFILVRTYTSNAFGYDFRSWARTPLYIYIEDLGSKSKLICPS